MRELAVNDRAGKPVLRIPQLSVDLASVEPLARKVHLSRIALHSPALTVRREKTGVTNLETLLPSEKAPQAQSTQKTSGEGIILDVDQIKIEKANVEFSDLATATPFRTTLAPIDLTASQLSNRPDTKGTFSVALRTEAKEDIVLEGGFSIAPVSVDGKFSVKAIPLKKYAPYYSDRILFDIESGKLDVAGQYRYAQADGKTEIAATGVSVLLSGLGLKRRDESQEFLQIPSLAVKDTQIDVSQRRVALGSLSTQKGALLVKRLRDGDLDLQQLVPPAEDLRPTAPTKATEAQPWIFTLARLAVDQYAVTFEDQTPSKPITLTIDQIRLNAENLSTAKNSTAKVHLGLRLDQAGTVSIEATLALEPLRMEGKAEVAGIALSRYAPYYQDQILFDVLDGTLDVATSYHVGQGKDALDINATGLSSTLRGLRLKARDAGRDFLILPLLSVKNASLDLTQRDVIIGEVSTERGSVHVTRSRAGEVNLLKLLPPPPATTTPAAPQQRPWTVKLAALSANQYQIQVDDAVPAEPVSLTIDEITLKANDLTTAKDQKGKFTLSLRLNQKGVVQVGGSVGITPLQADLDLVLKDVDLRPAQPYFTDRVKIVLTDGSVSANGKVSLADQDGTGLRVSYKGEVALNHFSSIDKAKAEDFLRWDSLALSEIDAAYNPFHFRAKKVALTNFYARLIMHPDGTLNLQEILERSEGTAPPSTETKASAPASPPARPIESPPAKTPEATADIKIDEVTLQAGRIDFADRSVKTNYSANLVEIGGRVSGLSSDYSTLADLDLRGRLENYAPLEITGKVNPLRQDLFVDLRARFRDMDLSPMTPYSGKYIGYTIQKGKLAFDLKYLIDKRKLDSQNVISLDQLTLGDPVDSPHATKLPVRLAIALLKDRNGEIRLDIPVTGSLDDPKFSVWGIIWQIVLNLITKAVTSPFALLGAAFGGGEELSHLEFDYGTATLTAASQKKVDSLIKALHGRPSLRLEIESYVDVDRDKESLRQTAFMRRLQAQKTLDQFKRGLPKVSLEEVKIEREEYEKYLQMAYDFEKFPKPRNVLGMAKALPVPEMEKLMLTHIEMTDDDLRALAAQRARAVVDAMVKSGQVEPERIFILEPKSLAPQQKEKLKDCRAELRIK